MTESIAANKKEQHLFDALLDAAVDAIIIIDQYGKILRFNLAAQRIFSYTEEQVINKNVSILMPGRNRSRHDQYLQKYHETGKAGIIGKGREERGLRSTGDIFPMRLSVGESILGDEVHYVGIIHDLSHHEETETKLHELEQQLSNAERLVTLGELTAGIAHEINQPLTAIAAYADAGSRMLGKLPDNGGEDLQLVCQRISEQARRAGQVVERLRGLVRGSTASKAPHDLRVVINSVLSLFEHELKRTGVELDLDFPKEIPKVFVDEIQIQQIIVNLIKNSMDSILDGRLGTRADLGRIVVSISQESNALAISVRDNGPGVSDENLARIFEPFYTSKARGVGLGLSICRNIAALHGGNLQFVPAEGGGAKFILTLPLSQIG